MSPSYGIGIDCGTGSAGSGAAASFSYSLYILSLLCVMIAAYNTFVCEQSSQLFKHAWLVHDCDNI